MNRREFIIGSMFCAMLPSVALGNSISNTDIMLEELVRCRDDIVYFTEKYIKVFDIYRGLVNVKLEDWQEKYLRRLASGKDAVLCSYRQSKKSTLGMVYSIWRANFYPNRRITFAALDRIYAKSIASQVRMMFGSLPKWLDSREVIDTKHLHQFQTACGSYVNIVSIEDDFCGYHPGDTLILDDFASYTCKGRQNAIDLIPVLTSSKNKQLIVQSTPCKANDAFHDIVKRLEDEDDEQLFKIGIYG